jgi:methylthioxylose transferase
LKITPILARCLNPVAAFFGGSTAVLREAKIDRMRRIAWIVVALEAALVAAFAFALRSATIPLGVAGEWEWQRLKVSPSSLAFLVSLVGVLLLSAFAAAGFRALSRKSSLRSEATWLMGLVVASVLAQGVVQEGAPEGYGLSKWVIALSSPGSSGYYTVAKTQMSDPQRFLSDYPGWIEKQDALHVGTHPPGLFLFARMNLSLMEANPVVARRVVDFSPPSISNAILALKDTENMTRADAAALYLTGALTMLSCCLTVVPLYLLARSSLPPAPAWASAAFWPLVPSALMFQPSADTAFPLLSTSALALASWAGRVSPICGILLCATSGLVMAVGMLFTLAFLPVGLVVALILTFNPVQSWRHRVGLLLATGFGFLAGALAWWASTSANPFVIWWVNQRNHGRFYVEYPRSYLGWIVENPIELAIALGLPSTVWGLIGLGSPRQVPRVVWATLAVLVVLTVSGKNLSEVARLWLPLMPPLLVAAGSGFARLGGGAGSLAGSIALVGLQVLILEATIQVVYPI